MTGLLIIGAGGHGKVVADTAYETGRWDKIAFLDNRYPTLKEVSGWPVLGNNDSGASLLDRYKDIIVAIGNNKLRIELLKEFAKKDFNIPTIVHPKAFVSRSAVIEDGTVIFSQAAINAEAKIGFGSIINTGATVDHDCILGTGVHLSPGVHLGGEVKIGDFTWLGVGSSVIHQSSIGENVIIGAGSVVINEIQNNVTVVGVPGRVIKKNE